MYVYITLSNLILRLQDYYFFKAHQHKDCRREKTEQFNGCNDVSLGDHRVLEGDRIPLLEGHGQQLKQKCCFSAVLGGINDASANFLNQIDSHGIPCTWCLDGDWTENVSGLQTAVLVYLLLGSLVGCSAWCGRSVGQVWLRICVWYCHVPCQRFPPGPG